MAIDTSAFGLKVILTASFTFPQGIEITQFADDTDPLDIAAIQVRDKAMGLNGDLVTWSKAIPVPLVLGVLANSDDDLNLQALLKANRPSRGRRAALDEITASVVYPDGSIQRLLRGVITDGIIGGPVASSGRLKSKPYTFAFEDIE